MSHHTFIYCAFKTGLLWVTLPLWFFFFHEEFTKTSSQLEHLWEQITGEVHQIITLLKTALYYIYMNFFMLKFIFCSYCFHVNFLCLVPVFTFCIVYLVWFHSYPNLFPWLLITYTCASLAFVYLYPSDSCGVLFLHRCNSST